MLSPSPAGWQPAAGLRPRRAAAAASVTIVIALLLTPSPSPAAAARVARGRPRALAAAAAATRRPDCDDSYVLKLAAAIQYATGRAVRPPPELLPCGRAQRRTSTFRVPPALIVGGFGDRLLGMVTVFYAALAQDAVFGVDWTSPYKMATYFQLPCATTTPLAAVNVTAVDVWDHFETDAWRLDVPADVVYHTNARHWLRVVQSGAAAAPAPSLLRALRLHELDQTTLFRVAVDALLGAPTPKLAARAASALPAGAPVVGVQIRVGGSQPKFLDSATRHTLDSAACFGPEVARQCASLRRCTVFLTADSHAAALLFKKAYKRACAAAPRRCGGVVEVRGDVLHTDRTNATDVAELAPELVDRLWTKSVLDWWLLKQADALVISRSGFGETAGWASAARSARRLTLQPEGVTKCEFGELTDELL